jgi:hypothetical protein
MEAVARRPEVRTFAENAAGKGSRKDQALRLFSVLKEVVHYYGDPLVAGDSIGVERMKAPWLMVEEVKSRGFAAGDCDDSATLAYCLLKSIGIQSALRVAWYGRENPQHIYAMALINGAWTAFDVVAPYMGFEKPATKYEDFL